MARPRPLGTQQSFGRRWGDVFRRHSREGTVLRVTSGQNRKDRSKPPDTNALLDPLPVSKAKNSWHGITKRHYQFRRGCAPRRALFVLSWVQALFRPILNGRADYWILLSHAVLYRATSHNTSQVRLGQCRASKSWHFPFSSGLVTFSSERVRNLTCLTTQRGLEPECVKIHCTLLHTVDFLAPVSFLSLSQT